MAKIKTEKLACFILFFFLIFIQYSFAEPQLVAASYQNFSVINGKPAVTENIKLKNIGDADAFNVYASIYSPDNTTELTEWASKQACIINPGQTVSISNGLDWGVISAPDGEKNYALNTTGAVCSEADFIDGDTGGKRHDYTKPVLITLPEPRVIDELIVYIGGISGEGYEAHYIRFKGSLNGSDWQTLAELSAVNGDGNFNSTTIFSIDPVAVKYVKYYATLTTNCGPVAGSCGYNLPTSEIKLNGSVYNYESPVVNIYYNDSSIEKRFLSEIKLENPDDSLDSYTTGDMIHEPKIRTLTPENYSYNGSNQLTLTYTNPHGKAVQDGKINSSYSLLNGTEINYQEETLDLNTGDTEISFTWNPSDYGSEAAGKQIKINSNALDYQGSVLDETIDIVNIEMPFKLNKLSPTGNQAISEGESQKFSVAASSELGGISYKWYLDGQEIDGETSDSYVYEADFQSNGFHNISAEAGDGTFSDIVSWNLTVHDVNAPPVLEPFVQINATEGDSIIILPNASDPDGDVLSFSYSPPLNETGMWQTTFEDSGLYNLSVEVSDGEFNDIQDVKINVSNLNRPPVFENYPNLIVEESSTIELLPNASDPDNENNVSNDDNILEFNYSGAMSSNTWETGYEDSGNYTVNITVSDGELIDSQNISIEVQDKDKPIPSPNPSSAGGGGGGSSGTPLPQCNAKIGNLYPNQTGVGKCKNAEEVYISRVQVTARKEIKNGLVQIIKFNQKPNSVSDAENSFVYLKIEPVNFENEDIEKVEIDFLVNRSWAEENGLDLSKGILYRSDGTSREWNENEGEKKYSRSDLIVFKTELPGFSYFAIGGKEPVQENESGLEKPTEIQENLKKTEAPNEVEEDQDPTMLITFNKVENSTTIILFSAILFAGLIAYGFHKGKLNKPNFNPERLNFKKYYIRLKNSSFPDLGLSDISKFDFSFPKLKKRTTKSVSYAGPIKEKPPVNIEITPKMRAVLGALHYREKEIMGTLILLGGDSTQAKIYHKTRMPTTTLSRWVDSLEKRGLVETKKHGKLRRVWLTEKFLK